MSDYDNKQDDFWFLMKKMWSILAYMIIVFAVLGFLMYGISSKRFNGYYIRNNCGVYQVWINWENAPDNIVAKTYNPKEAIEMLEKLNKIGYLGGKK